MCRSLYSLLSTAHLLCGEAAVVVLRIERSVIRLSAEFRPPAFDYLTRLQ